jgi:hypothetical protein
MNAMNDNNEYRFMAKSIEKNGRERKPAAINPFDMIKKACVADSGFS